VNLFMVRTPEECSYACGSDEVTGPCWGQGSCLFVGPNQGPNMQLQPRVRQPCFQPWVLCASKCHHLPTPPAAPPRALTQGWSFRTAQQEPSTAGHGT